MERLKRYLEDESISQTDFARSVGVTQPTVWGWIKGGSFPSTKRLRKISEVTGLTVDDLINGSRRRAKHVSQPSQ